MGEAVRGEGISSERSRGVGDRVETEAGGRGEIIRRGRMVRRWRNKQGQVVGIAGDQPRMGLPGGTEGGSGCKWGAARGEALQRAYRNNRNR
jgi:hypothetical protein